MTPTNYNDDDIEVDPMTPEHFDIAAAEIHFKRADMKAACRAVLVDRQRPTEVAEAMDIPQPQISRAVTRVQAKWQEICERENLVYRTVALSPEAMAVVAELEGKYILELKEKALAKKKKNKPKE